jgi:ketosteroid isomerase-like protein
MIKSLFGLLLIAGLFSCNRKPPAINLEEVKSTIFETDRAFSKMSEVKGLKNAYMEYIDSNGVLLRPNNYPIAGGEAVNFISQSNDSAFVMTWEPKMATIAGSGDLAYTYGIYSYKAKNEDSVFFGSYVTIWKKQLDGKWKFVLQTGNEGLE